MTIVLTKSADAILKSVLGFFVIEGCQMLPKAHTRNQRKILEMLNNCFIDVYGTIMQVLYENSLIQSGFVSKIGVIEPFSDGSIPNSPRSIVWAIC